MYNWFSREEGVLLIWLLIAHISTDFILQNGKLIKNKYNRLFGSWFLYVHSLIAGITVLLATNFRSPLWIPLVVSISHFIIDAIKIKLDKNRTSRAFIIDQIAHFTIIIAAWLVYINKWGEIIKMIHYFFNDYKTMLILIGYLWLIYPTAYIIKFSIKNLLKNNDSQTSPSNSEKNDIENAGKYIGIFERIIILTLVLFNQYEAIGFLVTGKSIIRLNSKGQTEYVLAGTLISYAISILTGVLINWLLTIK